MPTSANQQRYWDTTGAAKTFTHPVDFSWLSGLEPGARILDYGCGYGRVTAQAREHGFTAVEGADPSPALIARARRTHPRLTFTVLDSPPRLPHPDDSVDAVLLIAVLTCVPDDDAQRGLIAELARVLRPGGLLHVSDLLLQTDPRNVARYERDVTAYGEFGVFRTDDGAVCRHHSAAHLDALLAGDFTVRATRTLPVPTMNANPVQARQLLAQRTR
ncbi:class I SAM-dependent methyltransferase [Actinoplanes sp. NPDC020271]|uniref:class I SAM-dependent methyltransferase n=1 Tax=Actinoplanes sp. NPDC020271 TaxID=3363896 RepID=UPI0037A9C012